MRTQSSEGDTVELFNNTNATIKSDQAAVLGGFTAVATEDVPPQSWGNFFVRGVIRIAANDGSAAANANDGGVVYYNTGSKSLTMTAGTNTPFAIIHGKRVDGNTRRAWLLSRAGTPAQA